MTSVPSNRVSGAPPGSPEHWIGPYRVLDVVGRGAQGVVYRAEDPRMGRQVALKVLTGMAGALTDRTLQRFRREAEAASRLQHPGICAVHDLGEDAGTYYIAMQLVEGVPLSRRIAEAQGQGQSGSCILLEAAASTPPQLEGGVGRSSTTGPPTSRQEVLAVVAFFEQAAQALHAAHVAGVIHRDIKPGNLLVAPDGRPVILDFGLARVEESEGPPLTVTGEIMGTPAYMSPEQLRPGGVRLDCRTDVYSLGVALYESLTLARPFSAPTREALYQAILTQQPVPPHRRNPAIPEDLAVVVETAIDKERDRRYQTALDLAEDLRRVRTLEPIQARPPSQLTRGLRWCRRNPALSAVILLAVLLFGVAPTVAALLVAGEKANTEEALEEARQNLERFIQVSDVKRLADAQREARRRLDQPGYTVADLEVVLETLTEPVARLPHHRETLAALEPGSWRHGVVQELVLELENVAAGVHDLHGGLGQARAVIDSVRSREARRRWEEVLEDLRHSPTYGELTLTPQVGLLPIGKDPGSGLWEFAHVRSGTIPARDQEGRLRMTPESGIVLVLLPAGSFAMGAAGWARTEPVHEVHVPVFLLSKYELTQGQWLLLDGENPSYHQGEEPATLLHPVENVLRSTVVTRLTAVGLRLPSEAEWEYACRAGSGTAYWFGDATAAPEDHEWTLRNSNGVTHPVGLLSANPFGLYDMLGNVHEWCADEWHAGYVGAPTDGSSRGEPGFGIGLARSGSYSSEPIGVHHCSRRFPFPTSHVAPSCGVRPACSIR